MNDLSNTLHSLSKIAAQDPSVVEPIALNLSKIAAQDPSAVEAIALNLSKIAVLDPSIVEAIALNLSKIAAQDPSLANALCAKMVKALTKFPTIGNQLRDFISDSQQQSKAWLVSEVKHLDLGTIFLCGGWFAFILQNNDLVYKRCISIEIDPVSIEVSKIINKELVIKDWKFQTSLADIHNVNFSQHEFIIHRSDGSQCVLVESPDTIINTSCEHINNFSTWYDKIPAGKLLILQSNDGFDIEGHVNCSRTLNDFARSTPMSKLLYNGERDMHKFTRFMRIGTK